MLTIEERDVVVAAMRKYPAGVNINSWGSSGEYFDENGTKDREEIKNLADAILLEHG